MKTTRYLQWTFAILVLTVVVGYNGCGETGFNAVYMSDLSSLGGGVKSQCDAQLMQVFSQTYFPLTSTNCNRCHSGAQGSTDLAVAFQSFTTLGKTLIDYQATHPHEDNGVNLTTQIAGIQSAWSEGQSAYMTCLSAAPVDGGGGGAGSGSSSGSGGGSSGSGSDVRLTDKVIPNIAATIAANGTFQTISWDVSLETASPSQQGMVNAVLTLDVRYSLQGTVPVGLEFKNPRMHLKAAGSPVVVTSLSFYLDKAYQNDATTYKTVNATVSSTTDVPLAPGFSNALVFYPQVTNNTLVSIDIGLNGGTSSGGGSGGSGGGASGTAVTFTQLISTDPTLGVFRNSCVGCHSGSSPSAGVDLTNYTMAVSKAARIQTRMNSATSPMPPQGMLPSASINVVNSWITGGTPQ